MKDFKFFRGKNSSLLFTTAIPRFAIYPTRIEDCEFCFQFNDDEPVVFATGTNECNITINPTTHGNITFNDNNNVFKIFARERE